MVKSKEWDWEKGSEDSIWFRPSEDVYYYMHIWKESGFKKLLDLGCGLGRNAIFFAGHAFEVEAIDLSQKGLDFLKESAERQNLKIDIRRGDMNDLPYEPNYFDCLLAYHVISHTDSEGIKNILSEMKRVLKPGGEFYITLCSKESPSFKSGKHPKIDENTILKTEGPEVDVPHYYSDLDNVRRILSDFQIKSIRHIQDIFEDTYSWHYFVYGCKMNE
ncbi:MAG: class I SAM-dependent methyltransferase [Bacillota bacterium]